MLIQQTVITKGKVTLIHHFTPELPFQTPPQDTNHVGERGSYAQKQLVCRKSKQPSAPPKHPLLDFLHLKNHISF